MAVAKADYSIRATEIIQRFYDKPTREITPSDHQGYCSTTFFVTFNDETTIVLQFRPKSRALLSEDKLNTVRSLLGTLVPSTRMLCEIEDEVLVYEMNRISGQPFVEMRKEPNFGPLLPSVAGGVGNLIAKSYLPGVRITSSQDWYRLVDKHLHAAVESTDPLVSRHREDYASLLSELHSGILNGSLVALSNIDFNPTNFIVSQTGVLGGLVDWEDLLEVPLGFETKALFWLAGWGAEEEHEFWDNREEIEASFWKAFWGSLPVDVRTQDLSVEVKFGMNLGAALSTTLNGTYNPGHFATLRSMLNYTIPTPTPY